MADLQLFGERERERVSNSADDGPVLRGAIVAVGVEGSDLGLVLGLAGVERVENGGAHQRPHRPGRRLRE